MGQLKDMPAEIDERVRQLKREGDDFQMGHKYLKAVKKHQEAIDLLPQPVEQWNYIRILWGSISTNFLLNAQFNKGKNGGYKEALDYLKQEMNLPDSVGDWFLHRKIGEIHFEMGNLEKAKEELMRAYKAKGRAAFNSMYDPKYFALIKPIVDGNENYTLSDTYQF